MTDSAIPAEPTRRKRRIFLLDDHPLARQGFAQLVDAEPDFLLVGQDQGGSECLPAIRIASPDLVCLDIAMKDTDGIELLKAIKSQFPNLPVLVVSMHDESLHAERALRAGAGGYIMKQEEPQTLLAAMRKVLSGGIYVSPDMSATLAGQMSQGRRRDGALPMDRLTDRELEIFRLISSGTTIKDIATRLVLSVKTVEAHREHIKQKLNLRSSSELLRFAIRNAPLDSKKGAYLTALP